MNEKTTYEDPSQRLFPRRAREIREEGGVSSAWFPSTIKQGSTPTRHTSSSDPSSTKTSPEQKVLADLSSGSSIVDSSYRRARAGTVPSSFGGSPVGKGDTRTSPNAGASFTTSIYDQDSAPRTRDNDTLGALPDLRASQNNSPSSRLRAGSLTLPQSRNAYSSAFGPSIFSTSWSQRVNNQQLPSSPAQSSFSRDDEQTPIKTLDYLGLAETPTPPRPLMNLSNLGLPAAGSSLPFVPDLSGMRRDPNRIRSYSVNAKEKYDHEYEDADHDDAAMAAESTNFAYNELYRGTPSRPRSRTAGVLDSPPSARVNKFAPMHSHMEHSVTAAEIDQYSRMEQYAQAENNSRGGLTGGDQSQYDDGMNSIGGYIQSQPTRALWLGNVPSTTPSAALLALFSPFGSIESARVLTHKSCAFVNFEMLESAVIARTAFNGKELFPGAGAVRIGFAKVPSANTSATPEPYNLLDPEHSLGADGSEVTDAKPPTVAAMRKELASLVIELGASDDEQTAILSTVDEAAKYAELYEEVPIMPEALNSRRYDAPKLRDIRKRIDNGGWSQDEIEGIAEDMLDEMSDLASDYLGNTVVQKLFEFCSDDVKIKMLDRVAPHLCEIGVHKNGTWAAQKIIDTATTPDEMQRIVDALRPCAPALFLDQFGNYVIQCCLKFGHQFNAFIFHAMLSHTWEIAQGRYGARAIRACLESHHTTKAQQRLLAAVVTIHSVQLATNANGALLLTWLLDTCMLPNRHRLLAPKLSQHLLHLCTHKLASLTVLKVINQRQEPEARDLIINNLFFSEDDKVLEGILQDQAHGPTVIFKIITTPYLDSEIRAKIVSHVRSVIQRGKFPLVAGSKRLMDEVGLSTRGLPPHEGQRNGYSPQYSASHFGNPVDASMSGPRSVGVDPATLQALGELSLASGNMGYGMSPQQLQQMQQQLQYQAMLQQSLRQNQYTYPPQLEYHDPYANHNATQNYGAYGHPHYAPQLYQQSSNHKRRH
ncbi:putative RNA binding protein Jsn1 [Taphrina deformans PYCC 5710]|uniref:RNA binding protein Jsn1 n=1 Tax=Taphrina deformans (strain PYCC 5710 / ATCC 11124 / CBS 356.35 / IMI 108563 / JCM 9778 / NBRC 8474) TaxID=1097556 RepID=R4X8P6_TAPDE|nr:putative RNA binding protein Jsn1 [Taphrina deformans PYCC 5710]|eukprot:CCG82014.1 putative RNA binding protein Jsn1 [Taphrina deformans PYCC 5710]